MVNSPGPSSSKTPPEEASKKKRTRRKPRSKSTKNDRFETIYHSSAQSNVENSSIFCDIDFNMTFVKQQTSCTVYRQRNKADGHIKIQSFTRNGAIPCVFKSKAYCDYEKTCKFLDKLANLSINGLHHKVKPDTVSKPKKEKEKKKKKKSVVNFPDYLLLDDVDSGLKSGTFMKGFVRVNPKNPKEAYVGNEDTTKSDYVITSVLDRNRAMDGDEVVLRLKPESKTMEVIFLAQKIHPRSAVGFLKPLEKNKEFALFTPRDRRIPKLKIPKISWPSGFQKQPELYSEILFVAQITDWKEVKYALGTLTENLGLNGDLKVESLAILREFLLDPTPYGEDVKRFLPKSNKIAADEFKYRADIRRKCVFTIDPLTARDLDDAVSCERLSNGNFEVGVHISDASFYLKEDTELDKQVRKKATTIYMVDNVYHMLPLELCLLCSLLPGQDKLSFSVFWEITPDAEIVNKRITRTVMNSCAQLAYEHAQLMIDDPDRVFCNDDLPTIHNGFKADDLCKIVNDLQMIAVQLRNKRIENGALKIDQVKLSFTLDPSTGKPLQFWTYENKPAHRLIEEFMLLANMTVAQWIYDAFPHLAFLRLHEPPKPTMIDDLQRNLETVGIHIDVASSRGIQSSLNKYISDDFLGRSRMAVLNHLFAKPMKRARYFCAGVQIDDVFTTNHYALSIPIYTHFTSPIRRYADIMVHRLLAASLNYTNPPEWIPEIVEETAEICNRQKYHAKKAGEASSDLYLAHYVEDNQPFVEDGVVVDAKERAIDVIVLKTGSVVRIYTNNFGENVKWKAEEISACEASENSKKMWRILVNYPKTQTREACAIVLEIFTLVRVELTRKPKSNKLEAKLMRP